MISVSNKSLHKKKKIFFFQARLPLNLAVSLDSLILENPRKVPLLHKNTLTCSTYRKSTNPTLNCQTAEFVGQILDEQKKNWFQSFPSWQFQALLTLFSKFFSSFPHGTCMLSGFCQYLALDRNYRPHWDCVPKQSDSSKNRHISASKKKLPQELSALFFLITENRTLTFFGAPFQGTLVQGWYKWPNFVLKTTTPEAINMTQKGQPQILGLSSSRFTRSYSGNPFWFLFLYWIICLNSIGEFLPDVKVPLLHTHFSNSFFSNPSFTKKSSERKEVSRLTKIS